MKSASNNLKAGIWVAAVLAGGVAILLALSGTTLFSRKNPYVVRYSLREGAAGLKNGSEVRVGGKMVGQVDRVEFETDQAGTPTSIRVDISIRRDLTLHKDAVVQLEPPLLGNVSVINIPSVGTGEVLPPGATIGGRLAPPSFLAQAGFGDEQRTQVQSILKNADEAAANVKGITADIKDSIKPAIEQYHATAAKVQDATETVKSKFKEWAPAVDETLANFRTFSADLRGQGDAVKNAMAQASAFIDDVTSSWKNNWKAGFDDILNNTRGFSQKLNGEIAQQISDTMERARSAADSFSATSQRVSSLIAENAPEVRLAVANARLAADQLKLMLTEVRRNPWRLLYQPGKKEFERELLFDAVREYEAAVAELNGVSARLEGATAAAQNQSNTLTQSAIEDLRKQVGAAVERYRLAGDRLRRVLETEQ